MAVSTAFGSGGCDRVAEQPGSRIAGVDALPLAAAGPSWAPAPQEVDGLTVLARADAQGFALSTRHGAVRFLSGVNLGSTTPGHQPGELAINADDYHAWFAAMGRMGVRVVRIYTIHPPAFYRELASYNLANPDAPLYLVHGVYFPDESYVDKQNLFDAAVTTAFRDELTDAVQAVHGDLQRAPMRGRASGAWDTDVSAWLAGWIVGVELDPDAIAVSDRRNAAAPGFTGRYFGALPDGSPTERWLAARMDELATAEAAHGRSTPIAFTNWPTVDPLVHPDEPLRQEDLVGVDANHIRPTTDWPAGTFASYHAYPYYPDFQRHEPALQAFSYRGRSDPYAGYLDALRRHHTGMPVLITEFGVPSSLGSAHNGPLGRNQGGHDERAAMNTTAELLRMIKDLGLAGGLVFAWTDEWFKFTWNTIAHQIPAERRQLWHDPLTNEQHFGIVAMDPTGAVNPDERTLPGADGVQADARVDEAYLHLEIRLDRPMPGPVTVGMDPLPAIRGEPPPTVTGSPAPAGAGDGNADAALVLDVTARTGQAWIRTGLDPLPLDFPAPPGARPDPVAGWQRYQLVTNRPLTVPTTGRRLPMEILDVGRLPHGHWDPANPHYDSRALWHADGAVLRLRIPWAFAGFADPSSKRVLVPAAIDRTVTSPGVTISVTTAGRTTTLGTVTWDDWQRVGYRERLKAGATTLRDALIATAG
ncbi:hypothetical protein GCM10009557_07000 [Virgisporangium ochraceum]